jgi:hypothetical protein
MFRCLKCGCSRTDARGFLSCVLCGAACGLRTEECYVTDDTKAKLLAHAEELKDFGLTLEEQRSLQKDAKTTIAAIALAIQIGRELQPGGVLRKLILYLHELAISRGEILRLRLTEPEEVDRILGTAFNFTDFARAIYVDPNRPADGEEEPYVLPALYGGELAEGKDKFEALVVFQNPLFPFTKEQWNTQSQCAGPEEAIKRHRKIFFRWLAGKDAELGELFRLLADNPSNPEDFFRRVYVTDIWKDAKNTDEVNTKKKHRPYGNYWRSKLKIEIASVPTQRMIFVGKEARWGYQHVPQGTRARCTVFPTWGPNRKIFAAEIRQIIADIRAGAF